MPPLMTAERFWQKCEKTDSGCWLWKAAVGNHGYGAVGWRGKVVTAPRLAYFLTHGVWPEVIRHTCDTKLCVNPAHLVDGTHQDNACDTMIRGRSFHGKLPVSQEERDSILQMHESKVPWKIMSRRSGRSIDTVRRIIQDAKHS